MCESDADFLSVSSVEFNVLDDDAIALLAAADLDLEDVDVENVAAGSLYEADSSHMTNKMAADDDDCDDLAAATVLKNDTDLPDYSTPSDKMLHFVFEL